eukprot:11675467-Prorocentrum_lima.AAC.1
MVAVPSGAARQGSFHQSHVQPCSFCQYQSAHAYFESMDPDTDTDSDFTDYDNEDLEYQALVRDNDPAD